MSKVFIIAGLGNPGSEYARTRHNIGFLLVEQLAERWQCGLSEERKFKARIGVTGRAEGKALLCQPQTYMNASGVAVAAIREFYKAPVEHVLVAVDDADLPFGMLRLRGDGSSGGHHGLDSIETHLDTRSYARLRMGIGRTNEGVRDIHNHVLGKFDAPERTALTKILDRAADQVECWLSSGLAKAMSQFNGLAI